MIPLLALCSLQDPVVVELERPSARRPDDGTFARAHDARWASDRRCLVAFHGEGRAEWRLELDEPYAGTLWLRYAARTEARLPFGWGVLEQAELAEVTLPATGGYAGKDAWGWAPLDQVDLPAGTHPFTLGAAPLRPDCVVLGGQERPTHLDPAPVPPPTEEEAARLAEPLQPPSPAWLEPFAGLEPPAWYDATRLCLHTRLGPPWVGEPEFERAEEAFAALGARSYVRHVHTRGEGLWWPSEAGPEAPWAEDDPVPAMATRARRHGLRLVGYYRHLEDRALAESHPAWLCRDDRGRVRTGRHDAPRVCLSSPYLDRLEARLLELVECGVDGIYFDEDHWPSEGCWCRSCEAGFRAFAGLALPARADREDPRYRRLLEFGALSMERAFARLRRSVKQRAPEVALLIGSHRAPDPLEHFGSDRLWRLADGVKTEYGKGHGVALRRFLREHPDVEAPPRDVWLALGWAFSRDAAEGRPPHVWCNDLKGPLQARAAAAAVIAHGGVANLDVDERALSEADHLAGAVALGGRMSAAIAGARAERWAAVHWPGALRERLVTDGEVYGWIAGPLGRAFEALLRARRPAGVITDSLLAEGDLGGYRVLFLPAPESLDEDQEAAVAAFREAGGVVVTEADELDVSSIEPPPWTVAGGHDRLHVVAHRSPDGGRLLALTNDPGWIYTGRRENRAGRPVALPAGVDEPPAACAGVRVRVPEGTTRVMEVLSGRELPIEDGVVAIPVFDVAVLLRLE